MSTFCLFSYLLLLVTGEHTSWWIVARQSSLTSITVMWSFLFGKLEDSSTWRRRVLLEINIRPNNVSKDCKSRDVHIPSFGTRLSSSVHSLEVHGLSPGCAYTVHGGVKYVRKDLAMFAPTEKRDVIATNIEATTTVNMSALESENGKLLNLSVYSSYA